MSKSTFRFFTTNTLVQVMQRANGTCVCHLHGHSGWITSLLVNAKLVVSGGLDKSVCVWLYEDHKNGPPTNILRQGAQVTTLSWAHPGMMYLFTTVPHPHGHWQLQELLGNQCYHYHYLRLGMTLQTVLLAEPTYRLLHPICYLLLLSPNNNFNRTKASQKRCI